MGDVLFMYVLPHVATIIGAIFALLIVTQAATAHRPAGSTIAWLLGVILLPYVGIPLYFLFGGRKLRRQLSTDRPAEAHAAVPLERMLEASGAAATTMRNTCELIISGEASFNAVIKVIDEAKSTVHVSTLIFSGDDVGSAIAEKLCARAKQGLQVRVLVDGFFEFRSKRAMIRRLRKAGAKVVWFAPILAMPFRNHANLRLHRKVVIADDRVAIVGGMNLAREYMGPTPCPDRWRDLSAVITGEAVRDLAKVFAGDWQYASQEVIEVNARPSADGNAQLQVVASGPNVPNDLLYDASLQMIFDAKKRLWLATPYFVPDEALTRAFVIAIRRGVDVRIVLPLHSNHSTADLAGAGFVRDVANAGGSVYCYTPTMLHAKAVVVDDNLAVIGSANMDMRSLFLNYGFGVFMRTRKQIDEVSAWFEATFPSCVPLPKSKRMRAFVESLARLLAPLE